MLTCFSNLKSQTTSGSMSEEHRQELLFGVQGAVNKGYITDFEKTIIPESFFINYSAENKKIIRGGGGFFINWKPSVNWECPWLGFQAELGYSLQGTKMQFNNYQTDFNYEIKALYNYANIGLISKFYPIQSPIFDRVSLGLGVQLSVITNKQNLFYKSGGTGYQPAFGSDSEQQRQLRDVIRGITSFNFIFNLSYEFDQENIPIILDFRHVSGSGDAIEVYPNSYNFANNPNRISYWEFKLGWVLKNGTGN